MSTGVTRMLGKSLVAVLWLIAFPAMATESTLKVYIWPDYIDPLIVSEFEKEFDTTIELSYFDSDETRDQELAVTGGRGHDVLIVNRLQIPKYARRGWLESMSEQTVPNRQHIDKQWQQSLGDVSDYGVAWFRGVLGLAYRHDLLPDGLHSWKQIMQPDESLRNRLAMPNYARELVAIALKSDGHSASSQDSALLGNAVRRLRAQKTFVRQFGIPSIDISSDLVVGRVWAGAFYNADCLRMQTFNKNIRFVIPEEGAILRVDYLTVAQSSSNKSLAFQFIDYLNEPTIAARQAEYVKLETLNAQARILLPEAILSNPLVYPDETSLENSEYLEPLPPRSLKHINIIGSELLY